jgi:fimbrial chaperone protein
MSVAMAMAIAALSTPAAWSSGLQVSPIGLTVLAKAQAEALWLTNTGNDTIHAQVRVFRWTQADGKDLLEPSRDLVVSPPMVTIAPGARQMVRVIRQVEPPADGIEGAYRVLVDELPVDAAKKEGLTFVLRYSIPVFLSPRGDPTVKATLQATREGPASGGALRVRNSGTGHAQIADIVRLGANGERTVLKAGLVGYTLAGSAMAWSLPAAPAGGSVRARINGDPTESTLVVDPGSR